MVTGGILLVLAAYLVGGLPIGWWMGRARGVDLRAHIAERRKYAAVAKARQ